MGSSRHHTDLPTRPLSLCLMLLATTARGADEWQPVATDLLAKEKTGFGGLTGVTVDRATGTLYVCLSDRGLFRSADQGKTWERHGKDASKGRTETPGCFQFDPTGKTKQFLLATVYGGPVVVGSTDPDGEWRVLDKKSVHVDWCAAGVVESADAGATWSKPLAVPKELKGVSALTWLEYDPKNDLLYVMKMGSDLYKLPRGK